MHDITWIRDNATAFDAGLARRGLDGLSASLIALDEARRAAIGALQDAQTRRNAISKEIGQAMAQKDMARADSLKAEVAALKEGTPALEAAERDAIKALNDTLAAIPNLPLAEVPEGADEHGNVEYRRHGQKPEEERGRLHGMNGLKEHFELGEALGQMDFELAAKLSGSRFVVLNRGVARLSRALGQFMLDWHTLPENNGLHGYAEVNPPLLVRDDAMFGTAQLPKFAEDQYFPIDGGSFSAVEKFINDGGDFDFTVGDLVENVQNVNKLLSRLMSLGFNEKTVDGVAQRAITGLINLQKLPESQQVIPPSSSEFGKSRSWLIPTAEVPLTNLVRESILDNLDGNPNRYTALTPCFRAEAGSAGRDTRGMLRQHQFEKVELVSITTPDASKAEHERMVACAESVLKKLDLHFRTMTLCTGDMGFASQKTYDIEVWLPGQKAYREISSCSVCGDFQARRMNARYRPKADASGKAGTPQFVHTLNGSGVAVGRALIAVMENYQNSDGSITVPDVLVPYMGGVTRIERAG